MYQAGHDLTINMSGPVYRVESFPVMRWAGLTVEQARAQPSRLLVARFELVPFAGRAGLVRDLSGWLGAAGPVSVRLVHGPADKPSPGWPRSSSATTPRGGWCGRLGRRLLLRRAKPLWGCLPGRRGC